jgi:hypothetical protein
MGWLFGGLFVALLVALAFRGKDGDLGAPRLWIGVLLASGFALAPLIRSLAPGAIGPEHQRILMLADALACLGFAVLFLAEVAPKVRLLGVLVVLVLGGQRARAAWQDTHDWAAAGDMAEELVRYTHDTLVAPSSKVQPSPRPVLSATPPRVYNGAYVLQWGVADRFRAPFPATPRPVWPWRTVFEGPEMGRNSVTQPELNLRWPFGRSRRMVPPLLVTSASPESAGQAPGDIAVTAALFTEPGPLFRCEGTFPGARFEVLLFTELGYGIGLYGGPKQRGEMHPPADGEVVPPPFGGTISLRELLMLEPRGTGTGGPQLWEVLALAADFGAHEAYLEFRAVDDARGKLDRAVGASSWVHLVWGDELRDAVRPFDSFE